MSAVNLGLYLIVVCCLSISERGENEACGALKDKRATIGTKVWFYRQQVMGLNSFVARLSETRNNGEKVPFIVTKAHGAGNNT